VADYLALHLAIYGALTLALAAWAGAWPRAQGWVWGLALAAYGLIAFGGILDRYVASFIPVAGRVPIMAVILPGAILAMLADAVLQEAGRAPLWRAGRRGSCSSRRSGWPWRWISNGSSSS
jgi:hypothetical protein